VCSIPLISEATVCTRCREREYSFGRNHALFEYRGSIRELIFQYKFEARKRAGRVVAGFLGGAYSALFGSLPAVPVPGHPRNVRKRGWDPMLEVGRVLGAVHGVPVMNLLRRGASREQKGLDFEERLANVQGTIALRTRAVPVPETLVLIDDVFTTGATASECARVLRRGGARHIEVLTLAID
jgi:ComF family protein